MTLNKGNKQALAISLGISRSSLYYQSLKPKQDWQLKIEIENVLREHPAYGSRRIAIHLKRNRKPIKRVMRLYGLKPYRRKGRKYRKSKAFRHFPNLLLTTIPSCQNHVWAADFTEISWREKLVFIATVIDLYSREIVGVAVALRKGSTLVIAALYGGLNHRSRPIIFHSDNGSEYDAHAFIGILEGVGSQISRSRPGCPWENGYQESWYGKFKVDLGDPNRFKSLGELVAEIYGTIWKYNHTRIHSALKMPPAVFAEKSQIAV